MKSVFVNINADWHKHKKPAIKLLMVFAVYATASMLLSHIYDQQRVELTQKERELSDARNLVLSRKAELLRRTRLDYINEKVKQFDLRLSPRDSLPLALNIDKQH